MTRTPDHARPPARRIALLRAIRALTLAVVAVSAVACSGRRYDPALATRPYPAHLVQFETIDIQVFREGAELIVVNATPQSFTDFDLWVNRRYMFHVDRLDAGETRRIGFGDFFDQWGETPVAGGFFRTDRPTPAVLVQLQIGTDEPLLGAISIPEEELF